MGLNAMLDVRERLFARYVAEGRTHRQSVEMAGFTCNPDKKGSELVKKPEIASLIQEKSLELEQNRAVSLQDHLDSLAMLRDDARDAGQYSAAIQAEHHRGKASRLYVEQSHVVEQKIGSPTEILDRLNGLLSHDTQD